MTAPHFPPQTPLPRQADPGPGSVSNGYGQAPPPPPQGYPAAPYGAPGPAPQYPPQYPPYPPYPQAQAPLPYPPGANPPGAYPPGAYPPVAYPPGAYPPAPAGVPGAQPAMYPPAPYAAAPAHAPVAPPPPAYDPFDFDQLLINQRAISLSERYDVLDPSGNPRFHVHRPIRARMTMLAGVARLAVSIGIYVLSVRFLLRGEILPAIVLLYIMGWAGALAYLLLSPFRHIYVYPGSDESQAPILSISQDTKLPFQRRFTIFDAAGAPIAQFNRQFLMGLVRRNWLVTAPDGTPICEVWEDSWLHSIARRVIGTPFGLLRANFHVFAPDGSWYGTFHRRWTLLDRYVLDLGGDPAPWRRLDRRIALGIGILLDSGERR